MVSCYCAHARRISIVIPTKNECDVIEKCLSSIFNQALQPLEVIVVDGGSSDGTLEKIKKFPVKVFIEQEQPSLPNARNIGVKNSSGEIILIMDADMVLNYDCLENAEKYFQDPNVIAVVPANIVDIHTYLEGLQFYWGKGTDTPLRHGSKQGLIASSLFIRKNAFYQMFFNTNLGFGEFIDFLDRLVKLYDDDNKIIKASNCIIHVHLPHTLKEIYEKYAWYGRTFYTYLITNFSLSTILNLCSLITPSIILILSVVYVVYRDIFPYLFLSSLFLIGRNLIACLRTRKLLFFKFLSYDFLRSIFFTFGMIQRLIIKRIGR